ncbi:hypothetical protein ACE193_10645 [Bernardetia sp. OM2101]|uniref:hypothetical protein n=1 Tax=Bernardetia sp. OM2101 TaxID=3344876 RepID=UPI0035D0FAB3
MEQLTIDFFKYGIYCLTIAVPIFILEKVGMYSNVKFVFSLGIRSFGKTIENITIIKLEGVKGQSISTEKTEFQFDENGVIYIKSFSNKYKKRNFGGSAMIKAVAKTVNKNTLKVQSYTFLQDTLYMIFLPIICIAGIIGASYNPDGNAELGFIPLVGGVIFFIISKFEHKRKFDKMCKELEEILKPKNDIITEKKFKN